MFTVTPTAPGAAQLEDVRLRFQDAVAGTFYRTMLKALRSTEKKPAYLHGGTMEDVFRSRLDDQFADTLARNHGEAFAAPLFERLEQAWTGRATAQEAAHVLDVMG